MPDTAISPPSFNEALEYRFYLLEIAHRISRTGHLETGGNVRDGEMYHFVIGRVERLGQYSYTVFGEETKDINHQFNFGIDFEGAITERLGSNPFVSEHFRQWLVDSTDLPKLERWRLECRLAAEKAAEALAAEVDTSKRICA